IDISLFTQWSTDFKKSAKSFVLVTNAISYEDTPESLSVVPTLQEAKDVIEMEEIERDLGF
ncbi:MAG: ribonuclease Z, partial [Flavobacteriaceae bacterium]|nr:ribonuclease Z [Flavobacteriaceae bacterium]